MATFLGFSPRALAFLAELAVNNRRDWFEAHRAVYDRDLLPAARSLVEALGEGLRPLAPGLVADPRVDRSIFRLYRDTRFSGDKSPYKTHLGLWLWEGPGPRMECSGFYFQLEPDELLLGVGLYLFPPRLLAAYRQEAAAPRTGPALAQAVAQALSAGPYELYGRRYQRVPRGYDSGHPNAELLKHNGLSALFSAPLPPEVGTPELPAYCLARFRDMLPVHQWLLAMTRRAWRPEAELPAPAPRRRR